MPNEPSEQRNDARAAELIEGAFTVRSDRDGVVHTIHLSGELDLATAPDVDQELQRVEATDVESIVLDLSGLRFIDSSGIRLLITAHHRSSADGNRLVLLRGRPAVERVFVLSGVCDLLPFAD